MDTTETHTAPDPDSPEPPTQPVDRPVSSRPKERCSYERCLTLAIAIRNDKPLCIRHLREEREKEQTND